MQRQTTGLDSIDAQFLDRGDLFGLEYAEGYVFCEVEDREAVRYRPHSQIGTVGSQTNNEATRLENANGDDILYVENSQRRVLHGAIGLYPEQLRMYVEYPEGKRGRMNWPNLNTPTASQGSDYGYISGMDSPLQRPTVESELIIPPNLHLGFDFYNPTSEAADVRLNLRFRNYAVDPIDPQSQGGRQQIRKIMSTGSPMPVYTVGFLGNKATYDIADTWEVQPVSEPRLERIMDNRGGR